MCGIAGFVLKDDMAASIEGIKRMTDAVSHRGPDGAGHFVDGNMALGHRRLSILDLSDHGAQPMQGERGNLVLTFNGEIYNYIEIREVLKAEGHIFHTETDSEVVLAAYGKWGRDCVHRFNGMWSLAIYDRVNRSIFFSRDRFGVKPFYYLETDKIFAFGSEIPQLLAFQDRVAANIDVVRSFIITSSSDLDEQTFFRDITSLPGGHSGAFCLKEGKLSIYRYYELEKQEEAAALDVDNATNRFRELFEDAVRLRLRSDVKVGTCLSGGLDSSSVAAIASRLYRRDANGRFAAITAVSEQQSNSEEHYAAMVVEASDLEWHRVKPSYDDFVSSLPAVVRAQGEPFGSPSLTMQYYVMKTARENGITVLLDGQGGDETLLGYERYYAAYVASSFRRDGVYATLQALRASAKNNTKMKGKNLLKQSLGWLAAPARYAFYKHRHRYFRDHSPRPRHISNFARYCFDSFKLQKMEVESTNLPRLLRYEDRNSMAHAIEARLPFLDYRLLEMNLSISDHYKIRDGWLKWLLRKAMDGILPAAIAWRKNKLGFEAPEDIWLNRHAVEMDRVILASRLIGELSKPGALAKMLPKLDKRSRWRLYSVALWENEFGVSA